MVDLDRPFELHGFHARCIGEKSPALFRRTHMLYALLLCVFGLFSTAASADQSPAKAGNIDLTTAKCSDFINDDVVTTTSIYGTTPPAFKSYYYFSLGYFTGIIAETKSPADAIEEAQAELARICMTKKDISFTAAVIAAAFNTIKPANQAPRARSRSNRPY